MKFSAKNKLQTATRLAFIFIGVVLHIKIGIWFFESVPSNPSMINNITVAGGAVMLCALITFPLVFVCLFIESLFWPLSSQTK